MADIAQSKVIIRNIIRGWIAVASIGAEEVTLTAEKYFNFDATMVINQIIKFDVKRVGDSVVNVAPIADPSSDTPADTALFTEIDNWIDSVEQSGGRQSSLTILIAGLGIYEISHKHNLSDSIAVI